MAKPVILDVDTGSDDAVAIMTAMLSNEIDLLGVTVTHGNQPLKYTLENTLRVVAYMGGGVPVYKGAQCPLVKDLLPGRVVNVGKTDVPKVVVDGKEISLHARDIGLPDGHLSPQPEPAAIFIARAVRTSPVPVTLVPIGPLTNIALALRLDPSIVSNIAEIALMGGGDHVGNRTAAAEFNFFADPEAAKIVLSCGAKVVIFGLNGTQSARFNYADAELFERINTKAAAFTGKLIRHRVDFENLSGSCHPDGRPVHDVLPMCYCIDPSIVDSMELVPCDIDIGGSISDGQLYCDRRPLAKQDYPTYVVYKVNKQKVLDLMTSILSKER